jgi:hypothetical protein
MVIKTQLSPQDIKSFLVHADPFLRRVAAESLEFDPLDEETADLVMEGLRTYGPSKSLWVLGALPHVPFSAEQYQEILTLSASQDEVTSTSLHNVLCFAPIPFLKANLEAIANLPHMEEGVLEQIRQKISLESKHPKQIWEEMIDFSEDHRDDFEAEFDYETISDKNRLLANASWPTDEDLIDFLLDPEVEGEWLEVFIIELLGMRRCTDAVPALVALLEDSDAELLLNHATDALARINAPETLELIKERYLECDDNPLDRLMLLDALTNLRLPGVKGLLQFILSRESDPANRTLAFLGLCKRFDAEGVKAAISAARSGDFDPEFTNLRADVIAYADMLGLSIKERDAWSKERDLQEAAMEKKLLEMMDDEGEESSASVTQFSGGTFARESSKVGRNDPCSCGSGKKYKNCCLATLQ